MKTAMQEFIEKLAIKSGDSFYAVAFYYDNDKIIKEALKKEKEQIVNAHINGQSEFDMLQFRDINKTLSDNYYTQTYSKDEFDFQMPEKEIEARNIIQDLKDRYEKD